MNNEDKNLKRNLVTYSVLVLSGLIGTVLLLTSHASTPGISNEAETGTTRGPAATTPDSTASGDTAVTFGQNKPIGVTGTWKLAFRDEFNGTALNTTKWHPNWFGEGGVMNNAGTYAANAAVREGNLVLTLASDTSGALVHTGYDAGKYQFRVGDYVEARLYMPGDGTTIYNWGAWWVSGPKWPSAGEHDIAESLGTLTVNYHSPSGGYGQGTVPGIWSNAYHTYGVHRKAASADVYYDGQLVKSYPTDDNGGGEELIFNIGSSKIRPNVYGTASKVKVDYVRAWKPAP